MPLFACPDCGRQVSDAAPACPGCGRPFQATGAFGPPAPAAYGPPPGYAALPQPAAEMVLFQDHLVTVTNMRAILPGVTYAMANITSVREFVEPKPVALVLVGLMALVLGAVCFSADVGTGPAVFTTIV